MLSVSFSSAFFRVQFTYSGSVAQGVPQTWQKRASVLRDAPHWAQNLDKESAWETFGGVGTPGAGAAGTLPGRVRLHINPPATISTTAPKSQKTQVGTVLLAAWLVPIAAGIPGGVSLSCIPITCSRDSEGSGSVLV